MSHRPFLLIYFCNLLFFWGNRYPKLFVSKKGQVLNIAAQVSDESHRLLVIYSRKNTEICDHTSIQYLKLKAKKNFRL